MASVSESGHAVNVSKFFSLITFVSTYEPTYNPSNVALKSEALFNLHNQATLALQEVIMANNAHKRAVNNCAVEFKSLRTLCTRIVNALAASDVSSGMLKDAKAINRKIQGKRAAPKLEVVPEGQEAPKYISVSQQSRVDLMEHFEALSALVESQPNYNPNEPDLKVTALKLKSEQLSAAIVPFQMHLHSYKAFEINATNYFMTRTQALLLLVIK